ncbi:LPS translocon maturation chaperone LptM [Chitinimonas sp. PSY-7]
MRVVTLCLLVCLLSACGFKGALYLPDAAKAPAKSKTQP